MGEATVSTPTVAAREMTCPAAFRCGWAGVVAQPAEIATMRLGT